MLKTFIQLAESNETGVIVNDAGDINVDAVILESVNGRAVSRAASGCICCSVGEDLQDAVDNLLEAHERTRTRVKRIILETSGLADPGAVIRAAGRLRQESFNLRIVATLDGSRGKWSDDFLPHEPAQLAAAHGIIVTKTDLCDEETLAEARLSALSFNPLVSPLILADPVSRARAAFSNVQVGKAPPVSPFHALPAAAHPRISILVARWAPTPDWPEIEEWLENIAGFCGDRMLRVKGVIAPNGESNRLLVNAVGRSFARPQILPAGNSEEGLILILRDVDGDEIDRFSHAVSCSPPTLTFARKKEAKVATSLRSGAISLAELP
ncbi:MAG: GTP-binding protein [Rhizobiaceae bacterium]|nr:GTP-binding protein [Rhizobiaceae bacterium]